VCLRHFSPVILAVDELPSHDDWALQNQCSSRENLCFEKLNTLYVIELKLQDNRLLATMLAWYASPLCWIL
jgi:hypothetical protein